MVDHFFPSIFLIKQLTDVNKISLLSKLLFQKTSYSFQFLSLISYTSIQ
jgi:hypothetical protein